MERGVVFSLGERRFGLALAAVTRVVRAVEVTRLVDGPAGVAGVIDVRGEVMPVIDPRARLGVAPRELDPDDQFVVVRSAGRSLALWVDKVVGVTRWEEGDFVGAEAVAPGDRSIQGVARGDDGLVVVHDLDALLAADVAVVPKEEGVA